MATSRTIIVAGAGIGGLTASLALVAAGYRVLILEREQKLEEAGAGLQLSPNATRVLIGLGLESLLLPNVVVPEAISVMTVRAAREITRIPLSDAKDRYGAPYWLVRRPDLQAALLAKVKDHPDIDLRLGSQFEDVATYPKGVTVVARKAASDNMARNQETALALIGADGVWSAVRHQLFPQARPQFTGRIAWRGTVDANQLPREFNARRVQLWMGPNAHLVAYPLSDGKHINMVAVVTGTWNRPGWSEPGDAADIAQHFAAPQWPIAPRMMIGAVENWRKWALFAVPDGGVWTKGNVALLGDAAHAMLPFVAQGANMAIEDAATLGRCLKDAGNMQAALAAYEKQRAPRISRVQRTARQTGQIYHLRGAMAFARDHAMRTLGGERLLARQDWIYSWPNK
ncbi:MAG: FAD-dependent monooxygenase [Xanthobacteraceae bacterium]|nr:FAD-dependent monooxygenase [Xanthobacteraceae bacterium]